MPVDPGARRRIRRQWWSFFAAFAALLCAWSLSTPLFAGTDESAHSIRAAAAARGEWVGDAVLRLGWHMDYDVPEAYAHTNDVGCFSPNAVAFGDASRTAETPVCLPSFAGSGRLVRASSYEFRGLPAYYAIVGLPTLAVPDGDGVYLMRVLSALGAAALAASAMVTVIARRRPAAMLVGLFLVLTPEVVYLASLVNPNGLEIVATVTLFVALLALAARERHESDARLVRRAGIALVVLVALRSLDPLVALLALTTFGVLAGGARARALWVRRDVRRWLAVTAGVVVLHGLWVALVALGYGEDRTGHGFAWAVGRWDDLLRESVGVLGSNDIRLPAAVYAAWAVVAVVAVGYGLVVGSRRHRAVVVGLLAVAAVLAIGVDGFNLPPLGFDWQGRYGLPLLAGAVLVALDGVRTRAPAAVRDRAHGAAATAAIVVLLGAQVVGFVGTARMLGLGRSSTAGPFAYLFDATWEPLLPPVLLLGLFVVGIALLGGAAAAAILPRRAATLPG